MGDVVRMSDYDRRPADRWEEPREPIEATIIVLPVTTLYLMEKAAFIVWGFCPRPAEDEPA